MPSRSLVHVLDDVRGGPARRVAGDAAAAVEIVDLTVDSRAVRPGWLFCCVRGERADGHDFAAEAVAAGAPALLVERELPVAVPQIVVTNSRAATGWLAAAVHGHPCDALSMVGVTGTNGKTTTSHLIGSVLRGAGRTVEVLGTLSGAHTTPEAPDLQRQLAQWRDAGVDAVAMEVSSHALALDRVAGARFDVAVFTNLGRDHLDLHGTVERYFAAKALLFEPQMAAMAVVNTDDVHGRLLFDSVSIPVVGFSYDDATDVRVGASSHSYRWRGVDVRVGIGGAFNVMNSLAAATACAAMGIDERVIADALAVAPPVPGRFEPISAGQDFAVIVDYAHTPDGLREALLAARHAGGRGQVIVVFGCGGDRDRAKRPEMGATAAELADRVVITSDNPRSEDPMAIINATVEGVPEDYRTNVVIEPDRRSAIAAALRMASEGDVVVIAGKGHEATQTIGDQVVPFDDRLVARELLGAPS
ncbi:MAG: UDP-N-acetylmuramoyl-L-alanyl-D-glutamate--2,6-diaminopimelate ligase [Actinobacteria bacterium]|nr:UDP-N-acetylmuramoyl-L-alanyl-D-glutamate--2,6-diaminopimelate ligase [Actinomycetota bacterium]